MEIVKVIYFISLLIFVAGFFLNIGYDWGKFEGVKKGKRFSDEDSITFNGIGQDPLTFTVKTLNEILKDHTDKALTTTFSIIPYGEASTPKE